MFIPTNNKEGIFWNKHGQLFPQNKKRNVLKNKH